MTKLTYFIILLISLVNTTNCLKKANESEYPKIENSDDKAIFFIFANLLMSTIVNYILSYFGITIPLGAFLISFGIILGICGTYSTVIREYLCFAATSPHIILIIFQPIITFKLSFSIDYHVFYKSIGQILIIAIPVYLSSIFLIGFLMTLIIKSEWPAVASILFGNCCFAIYPISLVRLLKNIGGHTRSLCNLLEGEATLNVGIHSIIVVLCIKHVHDIGTISLTGEIINLLITSLVIKPFISIIFALIGCFLMRQCYNDSVNLILFCMTYPLLSFYVTYQIPGSGALATFIMGFIMGLERKSLPNKSNELLLKAWEILVLIMTDLIYTVTGIWFAFYIIWWMDNTDFIWIFVTYIMANFIRFISFAIFLPFLKKIGYGLNFQNMLILVWGGLRNPILLISAMALKEISTLESEDVHLIFMHVVGLSLLDMIINGTTAPFVLKIMGITQISLTKQINMNNCMKFILERRERTLTVLKMDRLLSDANWTVVNTSTEITHPYAINIDNTTEDEITLENRIITCPQCSTDIPEEPTPREFKEMMREARLRCLKTKKIAYIKQYESGLISKEGLKMLIQFVEAAMDSTELSMDIGQFEKMFQKHVDNNRASINRINYMFKEDHLTPPKSCCRRICYNIMWNKYFSIFLYFIVTANVIIGTSEVILPIYVSLNRNDRMIFAIINTIFVTAYLVEFIVKVNGYATEHLIQDGFKTYFKSIWNIIDFIVLIFCMLDVTILYLNAVYNDLNIVSTYLYSLITFKYLRCLRYFRLLQQCKVWYPKFVEIFEKRSDKEMAFAFEVGFALVKGELEVLEMLPYMIDNEKVREEIKLTLQKRRVLIMNLLSKSKKRKAWISVTVKTKKAIITILNNIKESINDLKLSGWIDDVENKKLLLSLDERYKFVSALHYIPSQRPREMFAEIPWMGKDEKLIDFLYSRVITRNYEPGDLICKEGQMLDGIYLIMTGYLIQNYYPNEQSMRQLKEFGVLPIVDYPGPEIFSESICDFIIRGNCFGEISALTERAYSCQIAAYEYSQLYIIRKEVLKEAIKLDEDPVHGFECRLWKSVSIRIAIPLMMSVPAYQSSDALNLIKTALERSFVPDLSNFKIFLANQKIEDILLIEGLVVDYSTRDIYTAPCYLPRSITKIMLPHSQTYITNDVKTKLLIIPIKDADEYDIMLEEENICELIDTTSSRLLRQKIQEQLLKKRKKRQVRAFGQSSRDLKQTGLLLRGGLPFVGESTTAVQPNINKKRLGSIFKK